MLARDLVGRVLDRVELRDTGPVPELAGRPVEAVEALGKHMLIQVGGDWSLRVHLGMKGRWQRRHVREARPRSPTVLLVSGDTAYTCERAYRAELIRTRAARSSLGLARLGPDLLADPPAIRQAVDRALLAGHAGREIGDLLLDQRVAAGIGNVYKSEVLFECRVHPRAAVRSLGREMLGELFGTAARQMRENLHTRRRTTVPLKRRPRPSSERLRVYGRTGKPCMECGDPIVRIVQGDMARSTYFCPECQRMGAQ